MKLDLGALRGIERERDVPFETLVAAIETALLTAYSTRRGAQPHARVEIDRKSGDVAVHRPRTRRRRRRWSGSGTTPRRTSAASRR